MVVQLVGVHAPQKHPSLVNLNEGECPLNDERCMADESIRPFDVRSEYFQVDTTDSVVLGLPA